MDDPALSTPKPDPLRLFLISFCCLFFEMACIRWLNSTVPVLSYFNNLILISCFFGLGVGCLLAGRKARLVSWFPLVFAFFVAAVMVLGSHSFEISNQGDFLFAPHPRADPNVIQVPLSAFAGFFTNMVFFVVLGQELGRQLSAMNSPLRAYSLDILGSLLGTLAYTGLAWTGTPPTLWFGLGFLLLCVFLPRKPWKAIVSVALLAASLAAVHQTCGQARWSPYYKVTAHPYQDARNREFGYVISVDGLRIQDALAFAPGIERTDLAPWIPYYLLPYAFIRPESGLYLGAGSGNEAVAATIAGVPEITAVEIDPVIADMGKTLHPNRPYLNPRVTLVVNDARAYLSSCKDKYDLVVMSALDSHKLVSGLSSLRLESYIYTKEAFQEIKRLLNPGGIFCLNLSSGRRWIAYRTYWSLAAAFGHEPLAVHSNAGPLGSIAYVLRNGEPPELPAGGGIERVPPFPRPEDLVLCTDNWPFLYLEKKSVPPLNLAVVALLFFACIAIVALAAPGARRPNLHYFFLGAGFMLLETRSITQLYLLFGLTWQVTALVVSAVLLAIFCVNLAVIQGRGISSRLSYPLLFATLILGFFFPFHDLLKLGFGARLLVSAFIVGLPIVWAGFIFSNSFKTETRVNSAFGSNLMGVVLGGSLEYACNLWGLNSLYLLAAGLYILSLLAAGDKLRPARAA
ncbi:MAG: methyltransferase domain-containing protein [Thermodesulfobacteriota bacterium]